MARSRAEKSSLSLWSASSIRWARPVSSRCAARSQIVRATLVVGMPSWVVTSSGSRLAVWARIVRRLHLLAGVVTWIFAEGSPMPQFAAAV